MTDDRPLGGVERIDLNQAEDPRDVVHRVVASLAQGERVLVSTAGIQGVMASALHPEGIEPAAHPAGSTAKPDTPTLLIRGADELSDWVPSLSELAGRLARRGWPGPLTLVFPGPEEGSLYQRLPSLARQRLTGGGGVALRVPNSSFARDVLRLLPVPALLWPLANGGPSGPDRAASAAVEMGCHLLVESAPAANEGIPTVVGIDGEHFSVLREGVLGKATLSRLAAKMILFVCTGNTCRSPMAEALCKVLLAERVGCAVGEIEARGYFVTSAGVAAMPGMPAATNAIDVVDGRGGSLQGHQSRRLTLDLIRQADHIVAMTGDHLEMLLEHVPEAAPRARLLHPEGNDVADPVGADRETYQRTADDIEAYLKVMLDSLGL